MLSNTIANSKLKLLWARHFQGVAAITFVAGGENEVRPNSLQCKAMNKVTLRYALHLLFDR